MSARLFGRVARPAAASWNLAKTLTQLVVFWTVFLAVIPTVAYALEPSVGLESWRFAGGKTAGAILFAFGSAVGFWSAVVMAFRGEGTPMPTDSTRKLVVSGPYRHIRNPMVMAGSAQAYAVGLWLGSPAVLLYVTAGMPLWNFFVRRWEEWDLERRFGEDYRRYRRHVMCWRPRLRPYDPARDAPVSAERTRRQHATVILFDGDCRFCERASLRLQRILAGERAVRVSFRTPFSLDAFPGVEAEDCDRRLHLVLPDGRVYAGAEAVVRALALRPLGSVAYLYYLPFIRLASDLAYAWIGRNRFRFMGRTDDCEGTCDKRDP